MARRRLGLGLRAPACRSVCRGAGIGIASRRSTTPSTARRRGDTAARSGKRGGRSPVCGTSRRVRKVRRRARTGAALCISALVSADQGGVVLTAATGWVELRLASNAASWAVIRSPGTAIVFSSPERDKRQGSAGAVAGGVPAALGAEIAVGDIELVRSLAGPAVDKAAQTIEIRLRDAKEGRCVLCFWADEHDKPLRGIFARLDADCSGRRLSRGKLSA